MLDEEGNQIGTSESVFEVVKELESDTGAVNRGIAFVSNTLELEGGTISIEGTLNIEEFEDLEPFKLKVIGGTGIFEGAKGKAIFQQQQENVLDIVEIDLRVIA